MGKRTQMPEHETNLLLTSGLILLICLILGAVAYFAFVLNIIDPPMTSHVPGRVGTTQNGGGIASPDGTGQTDDAAGENDTILFPGFVDFSITDGVDTVTLSNDSQNTVAFRFTITDEDGQVLYGTEEIQPGQSDQWTVTDAFDPGTGAHAITVKTDAFRLSDGSQLNGTSTTFTVDMG